MAGRLSACPTPDVGMKADVAGLKACSTTTAKKAGKKAVRLISLDLVYYVAEGFSLREADHVVQN